ncbi:tetratricopeptide repeat protein [Hymenobacter sediminis]|uniref:DUF6377 domain-containing protein n=1 Tax=Hymenobacter sediminis TaxID=2218621 RepID=UPI000DA6AC74|nr:DUF6377 domain-containing protein [Hymenobacter sediminis]RPD44992.1 tetratricopeptide repeat protein [Hymenobacter sediminis]
MKFFFLFGIFLLSLHSSVADSRSRGQLHQELKQALQHKQEYDAQRRNRIAILTAAYASNKKDNEAKFDLGLRIYDEYKAFKYDSAFAYSQKITQVAHRLNNPEKTEIAKLKLAFILLSSGMFKETFETIDAIRPNRLSSADKLDYYFLKARAYSDLGVFNQDQVYQPAYNTKAQAYADTALQFSQPGTYDNLAIRQFQAVKSGALQEGVDLYRQIRALPNLTLHQLAVSASTTAYIYTLLQQEEKAYELLLVSATADVKSATKETVAIFQLSDYCYRHGDLENAYAYIKEARAQAAFYKARQRQIEISHISSVIEAQKINIIENQRRSLKIYAVAVTVLVLFAIGFVIIIFQQLRKLQKAGQLISVTNRELQERNHELRQLNTGLNEANKIKEEYIAYYFHNNSQLIDKLDVLRKALDTQLENKQYGAVRKLVDAINIKQQRNELFKGFDTVFLRLFPHFIEQFNSLFKQEDQYHVSEEQLLPTELRIFALIRLGITDSEQISRMLGYSINTIYTYKTRVKNRSIIPNEEFEARILAINAI